MTKIRLKQTQLSYIPAKREEFHTEPRYLTAGEEVKRRAMKAGIHLDPKTKESKVSAHWFRHTYFRRSQMAGRDMKVVQQNTGDTEQTILKYYRELTIEDQVKETEEKPLV